MTVVPDGLEVEERVVHRPRGALVAALIAAALVAMLLVSGGTEQIVSTPESTLPEIEMLVTDGAWSRLELPGSEPLEAVAFLGAGQGYVAAGVGPQFWWSPDGETWQLGTAPDGPRHVYDVADLGGRIVAVGAEREISGRSQPAAWTVDGGSEDWEVNVIPLEGNGGFEGITSGIGAAVAWGWVGSPTDFDPETDPLVFATTDGGDWHEIAFPSGMRVHAVRYLLNRWYVMGSLIGRPTLFRSVDLTEWERIPTDSLPFGWLMTDLVLQDTNLVATILDQTVDRTRMWIYDGVGTWSGHGSPTMEGPVVIHGDATADIGVGFGHLWTGTTTWEDANLAGEVADVAGNVAVGGVNGQPAVWVRGVPVDGLVATSPDPGTTWRVVAELGRGEMSGPWLVAGEWLVGVGTDWWRVNGRGAERVESLSGRDVTRIDRVDDEWVAIPAMMWSDDGLRWEQRAEPWPNAAAGQGFVAAIADQEDGAMAVGLDEDRLWAVAKSVDHGRTWLLAADPVPSTPVWQIRPVGGKVVGMAAMIRSTEQLAYSNDGITWQALMDGSLVELAEPATVVTDDGEMVVLDTNESLPLPARPVTAVARGREGVLAVVADGSLWVRSPPGAAEPAGWVELPLDASHGVSAAQVRPMPHPDGQLVVVLDHGDVRVLGWPLSLD